MEVQWWQYHRCGGRGGGTWRLEGVHGAWCDSGAWESMGIIIIIIVVIIIIIIIVFVIVSIIGIIVGSIVMWNGGVICRGVHWRGCC